MSRVPLWLVMLPLVAASAEGGATIVDQFAPASYEGAELFSASNASHALLPLALAIGGAMLVGAVISLAAAGTRTLQRPPSWVFACLPPLVFTLQEHVENAIAHGQMPWTLVATPTFAMGLLLQIPFAAAAFLVARLLLRVAAAIARRGSEQLRACRQAVVVVRPRQDAPRRTRAVGDCRLTRGPPHPLAV